MINKQLNLFDDLRATSSEAIASSARSLNTYGEKYDHWTISFSGGKDSSCLVTLVLYLIETGRVSPPKSLHVLYADTRLELPPLQMSAMQILREVEQRGFNTQIVTAELDKRFLVYVLGRGVPPPNNNTLRYCTQNIKLDPMKVAMQELYNQHGSKLLSLNGVRIGESAMRDARIAVSCSKNGSECGQGWFQRDLPDAICDKLSPILHWRVCHVWDWLMVDAPRLGFDTEILAEVYGGDEATELNARTGCIGCPLATKDTAVEYLVKLPQWFYLEPLLKIRGLWEWARRFENRHQKVGEKNKDGSFSSHPCRKGPLTLEARKKLLAQILALQDEVNTNARALNRPKIDLINALELNRITELIDARTYPNKWTGDEPTGDVLVPQIYNNGTMQPLLFN
jgi:DNA sulfur modification protein DndC